jgi:hypothetical protein
MNVVAQDTPSGQAAGGDHEKCHEHFPAAVHEAERRGDDQQKRDSLSDPGTNQPDCLCVLRDILEV